MGRLRAVGSALCATLLVVGCLPGGGSVPRVYDGLSERGREIPPEAYDAYLEGSLREARGDLPGAASAYHRALELDPSSPEILSRLAAIRCRTSNDDVASTFRRALDEAPGYGPVWLEKSLCESARGQKQAAVASALEAARLLPLDERSTRRVAEALDDQGHAADATRWRRAWRYRSGPLASSVDEITGVDAPGARQDVDEALSRADLTAARARAVHERLSPGELALRAAELGHATVAMSQAEVAFAANPDDVEAWVAAVVAADYARDDAALGRWLERRPSVIDGVSAAAVAALAALIERRTGRAARTAFEGAAQVLVALDGQQTTDAPPPREPQAPDSPRKPAPEPVTTPRQ